MPNRRRAAARRSERDHLHSRGIGAHEIDEIPTRPLGVGHHGRGPDEVSHCPAEEPCRDRETVQGLDAPGGEREQHHVVAGDDRPGRVEEVDEVAVAVVDDVKDIRRRPLRSSWVENVTPAERVEPGKRRDPPRPLGEERLHGDVLHGHSALRESLSEARSVEPHARVLRVAIGVEEGDAGTGLHEPIQVRSNRAHRTG